VWDAATGRKLHTVADRNDLWAVLPTPDPGRLVVMQTHFGSRYVRVVEADSGKVAKDFGEQWVSDYALTADGKVLWAVGDFGTNAWDLAALRVAGGSETARGDSLAFVPGAGRLLVGHDGIHRTRLVAYKVEGFALERLRAVQEHRTDVTAVAVSPDGRLAATADEGGAIKLWNVPALTRP
jgi:WD40 repeat protein